MRDGKSFQQISKDIKGIEPRLTSFRAKRIAATETHTALTKTVHDTVASFNVQATKNWNPVLDERTRAAHVQAFSQRNIPTNLPFIVMGEALMYPGDPAGSAKNIIFCRCVATYNIT